jgi:hypothetical protein
MDTAAMALTAAVMATLIVGRKTLPRMIASLCPAVVYCNAIPPMNLWLM